MGMGVVLLACIEITVPDTGGPKTYGSPTLKVTKQKMWIQLFLTVAFKN